MKTTILDLSGLKCPMPVLRTQRALRDMQPGDRLEVTATDPMSSIDIPNLLRETGDRLLEQERDGARFAFRIEKSPP